MIIHLLCCGRYFTLGLFNLLFLFMRVFMFNSEKITENEKIPHKCTAQPLLPDAIVFNVDELFWPYKVDRVMTPPLSTGRSKNEIKDRMGKVYVLFNNTRAILDDLFAKWHPLGGMAISTDPEKIENIMNLYDIDRYFKFFEVFPRTPGCKVKHMKRMGERLKVDLDKILYFDSDEDQLDEVKLLNVTIIKVPAKVGLTYNLLQHGFQEYDEIHNVSVLQDR